MAHFDSMLLQPPNSESLASTLGSSTLHLLTEGYEESRLAMQAHGCLVERPLSSGLLRSDCVKRAATLLGSIWLSFEYLSLFELSFNNPTETLLHCPDFLCFNQFCRKSVNLAGRVFRV